MNKGKLIGFLIVFSVLIVLFFVKNTLQEETPIDTERVQVITGAFLPASATQLQVYFKQDEQASRFSFLRQGDGWGAIEPFQAPVLLEQIESFLEQLTGLRGEQRSQSKELFQDYGISDEEGIHLEIVSSSGEKAHLILGSRKAGWKGNFIRQASDQTVFYVEENLLASLGFWSDVSPDALDLQEWFDKSLLKWSEEEMTSVSIFQFGETEMKVLGLLLRGQEEERKWGFDRTYAIPIDEEKANAFIREIADWQVSRLLAPGENEDLFAIPGWKLIVQASDGNVRTFSITDSDAEGNVFLRDSEEGIVFSVSKGSFQNILKTDAALFSENPFSVNPEEISQIQIETGEGKYFEIIPSEREEEAEISGPVWQTKKGIAPQEGTVEAVLDSLTSIQLDSTSELFPEDVPDFKVSWKQAEESFTIRFGPEREEDNRRLARWDATGDLYLVQDDVSEKLQELLSGLQDETRSEKSEA